MAKHFTLDISKTNKVVESKEEVKKEEKTIQSVKLRFSYTINWTKINFNAEDVPSLSSFTDIVFDRKNHLCTSKSIDNHNLFAVSSSTMTFGRNCESAGGITFLPPGYRWIKLALLCQGIEKNTLSMHENKKDGIFIYLYICVCVYIIIHVCVCMYKIYAIYIIFLLLLLLLLYYYCI